MPHRRKSSAGFIDLSGQRFERLQVLWPAAEKARRDAATSDEHLVEVSKQIAYALGCPCADMTDEEYEKLSDEQVDEIGNQKAITILRALLVEAGVQLNDIS